MMANPPSATPLKSILKQSSSYPATSSFSPSSHPPSIPTPPPTSREDRDRDVALYHANLIQQRKDVEFTIVLNMETLIDYPLSGAPYSASNPSPADARTFKTLLRPFQPSDYDALIVERNINERCGFALCAAPNRKERGGGVYRLTGMNGRAKDFKVVKKEELEKWCSEACAKRALYVRVQLGESPAWEREGAAYGGGDIELLDEPRTEEDEVAEGIGMMDISSSAGEDEGRIQDNANLALERGDRDKMRSGLMDIRIRENETRGAQPPSFDTEELSGRLDTMHLTMEGHTPSFGNRGQRPHGEASADNEGDTDVTRDWGF